MKKKMIIFMLVSAMLIPLCGCAVAESPAGEEVDYTDVYRGVLNFYSDYLSGLIEVDYSLDIDYTCIWGLRDYWWGQEYDPEACPRDEVGYCIKDVSGDGIPELLICATYEPDPASAEPDGSYIPDCGDVLALYTCCNGEPGLVFCGWARNHFWLTDDNTFYNPPYCGSYIWLEKHRLSEDGTALECIDCWECDWAYVQELEDGSKEGWHFYHMKEYDLSSSGNFRVDMSKEEFDAVAEEMKSHVVHPELIPFSDYVREEGDIIYPWDVTLPGFDQS